MKGRGTQRERLLKLLRENSEQWVGLPRILDLRISQYSARVHELRKMGYCIENRIEHHNEQVRSWFRLVLPKVQENLLEPEPEPKRTGEHFLEPEIQRRL